MDTKSHLERAVEVFGSQKKLADAVGCSQQHISLLLRGEVKVTGEIAVAIDEATKGDVSRRELRPDLFGASRKKRSDLQVSEDAA
jgi:DNA-binding transcriptional regulator YdaS (Cro superfamily)